LAVMAVLSQHSNLPKEALVMAGVFMLATWLWLTEAVPLFATSILIIGLQVLLLGNPGGWSFLGYESGLGPDYTHFLTPLADPVIVLFFGGFILAIATVKEGVDKALAGEILTIFGKNSTLLLFSIMGITAVFSMWMSNTATTAMMITLAMPLVARFKPGNPFRRGLLLSIPFAANIGGMGTPISSPPNAVAVSFLKNSGIEISFFKWFVLAFPIWLILLALVFLFILKTYRSNEEPLAIKPERPGIDKRGWFVISIFALTVLLWLSDQFHGLPSAVVALIPPIVFTTTGLVKTRDLQKLDWHILLLIAGGIALGSGIQSTGLDTYILDLIPSESTYIFVLVLLSTMLLSSFISNTASANLLIPLALALSYSIDSYNATSLVMGVALAASCSMILPVSTPPNAMAYAKGELKASDFMKGGLLAAGCGLLLMIFYFKFLSYLAWI
jgi:sodium-dependent dicarboxylate transporter 2/3/5